MVLELADGRRVVTISVGEKQVTSLRLRFHGRAGHASVPAGADNVAPPRRRRRSSGCSTTSRRPKLTPAIAAALDGLGAPAGRRRGDRLGGRAASGARRDGAGDDPDDDHADRSADVRASNVIPPFADVVCDCRALPGEGEADVREQVDRALGDGLDYELELLEPLEGGTESPIDTPLYRLCEEYVAERLPGAELCRSSPRLHRLALGARRARTVAYGFAPVFTTTDAVYSTACHGADEAIDDRGPGRDDASSTCR